MTSARPEPSVVRVVAFSGFAGGLVVAGRVEGELAEEFTGGGVDDADVEVVDEHQDWRAGVGAADADVVEAAVVAEGDAAGGVDAVVAFAPGVAGLAGGGFGESGVGGVGVRRLSERWGRWWLSS